MIKKIERILLASCLLFSLSGCTVLNPKDSQDRSTMTYQAATPFVSSDTRVKHVSLISDADVRTEVESGLMDLAKEHFPPNSVTYRVHSFLNYDELDATDGSRGLLGTLRDGNPNGLNPNSNEDFDTGNGIVKGGVILVDIYELDFYKDDQLDGIALSLVVNDKIVYNNQDYEITPEKMQAYLEVTSNKLATYMKERFNEITNRVPILIAAYELNSDAMSSSKGGYVYEGYYNGNSSSFKALSQEHVIVPGSSFSELDPNMASEFNAYKADLLHILPDATFVSGEAKFESGKCTKLDLTITSHGKSVGEILAVIQVAKEGMKHFSPIDVQYDVEVINDGRVYALLRRSKGQDSVEEMTWI
ncbi:CamS family sex pheromone protein [Dubosiella newyorkensis]|uniref:CamS family sex pheromone protein n=1 Tax=Dubosiella newyorkensis TaxID=1862672 RepID=UPI00257318A4|nr:CamS family sex pheromone protein [Dubosiella newyorkensis]